MNPVSIRDLAKWYGEIAGLNKVNLELQPGKAALRQDQNGRKRHHG